VNIFLVLSLTLGKGLSVFYKPTFPLVFKMIFHYFFPCAPGPTNFGHANPLRCLGGFSPYQPQMKIVAPAPLP